jgi:hypothetical protein
MTFTALCRYCSGVFFLLGTNAMSVVNWFPDVFRQHAGLKMSGIIYPMTQFDILEEWILQPTPAKT